jgi:hypothetical protein
MPGILDIDLKSFGIAKVLQQYRLRVPPYQRAYAWRDEHVRQLFDDWGDAYTADKTRHYFLGTIVLNKTSDEDIVEISDGQQRLATTAIFIAAVRDVLEAGGKMQKTTAEKYTRNYLIEFEELVGDWIPRLQLNSQDNSYFRQAILVSPSMRDEADSAGIRRTSNERLARAYELARERVETLLKSVSTQYGVRILYGWLNYLMNNVAVVVITVPEDVDEYTMFETLNERGLRASQVDNIKNRLFREAGARLTEIEDMWLSMIAQIESFGSDDTVISYLRHHWIAENGPTREQDLAKKFRASITGQASVATFVEKLDAHAADYEALCFAPLEHRKLDALGANGRGYVAAITRVLGIEQIRPLMMAVLWAFSTTEAVKAFQVMLSWSVRFLIVGTGGGGYLDTNYGRAASKISARLVTTARGLRDEFAQIAPNDAQFETAFRTHSITNAEIARYVCRSIEAHLRNERFSSIVFFENTNSSNLEHVLPRWPSAEWNIPHDVARAYFKRIGNLALLDPKVNVEIGNQSFDNKRSAYNKSPFLITQELGREIAWTPEKIEERQARLAKYAPLIWPLTWA